MPELPEVETIARQLSRVLESRTLTGLRVIDRKLGKIPVDRFSSRRLLQVIRSGKEILLAFSGDLWLKIHLRMTGRLIWFEGEHHLDSNLALYRRTIESLSIREKAIRAEFRFQGGVLYFEDVRRFGTIKVITHASEIGHPGLDPVSPAFTKSALQKLLCDSRQPIKTWLLRQEKIVGIGNIYASEILFRSKINPDRPANSLSDTEVGRLRTATIQILTRAIEMQGTTFSDYRDSKGESGGYQNLLAVYDREDKPCRRCKNPITCMRQAQRSTYFCAKCQK
jgi:formamidopyrimidine-DNA glycosylase